MSSRMIPSDFLKSVLQNGSGRYVCQLQRLTLKFCKSHAGSRGMRDFIEQNLLDFTRRNPGVVVYLQPKRHRTPRLVAEYLNGNVVQKNIEMLNAEEVCQWVEHLRSRSGRELVRMRKQWHTDTPTIQGIWTPFTNMDTEINIKTFPNREASEYVTEDTSATDRLLQMAKQLRLQNVAEVEEKDAPSCKET